MEDQRDDQHENLPGDEIRKTPLYERHVRHGGKMVPFAGYSLPVQYAAGVIAEHRAVREGVGLFDVSHMGEILFQGRDALLNLQRLLCNDFEGLPVGRIRYSPMLNDRGGVVDDVLVYRFAEQEYLMVVNAANRRKDMSHILAEVFGQAHVVDLSDEICQLALQGPKAEGVLRSLMRDGGVPQKYYSFLRDVDVKGINCLISRTGYTGEDGFELYADAKDAERLFDLLMEAGSPFDLQLCGLGCRDTLRLEAAMPLYGHEMDESVSPLEAGLSPFVKMGKPGFIGKEALAAALKSVPADMTAGKAEDLPKRIRVGLKMVGRGIARERYPVFGIGQPALEKPDQARPIGYVTSGTFVPTQQTAIAMALVDAAYGMPGTRLAVDIRGKLAEAEVVPLPFYTRQKQ